MIVDTFVGGSALALSGFEVPEVLLTFGTHTHSDEDSVDEAAEESAAAGTADSQEAATQQDPQEGDAADDATPADATPEDEPSAEPSADEQREAEEQKQREEEKARREAERREQRRKRNDEIREAYLHYYFRWTHHWHVCNVFCKAYLLLDVLVFAAHILFMGKQLGGWAGGSITLILNTFWTYFQTLNGIALMLGLPDYMMSSYNYRFSTFVMALACVFWYLKSLGDIVYNYFKAATPQDSFL